MRVFKSSPRLGTLVGKTVAVRTVGLDSRDYTIVKVEAVDVVNHYEKRPGERLPFNLEGKRLLPVSQNMIRR